MSLSSTRSRRSWAGTVLTAVPFVLATLATPVVAQVATDRQVGARGGSAPGLAPFAGRRVAAIDVTGHNVTKDWVITREIRTKVGDPLDLEAVGRDVARLDNLSIFAEIRVDGEPVGDDAVRLVFTFKEMPSWFPTSPTCTPRRTASRGAWASRRGTSPAATCPTPPASTSATSSSSGAGSPGPGSGATTGPSTSTARATRGRTRCAASRRRATSSRPRWARGPATTAGPGPSSRTSR